MSEFTLGGYMAAHERAAAFSGSDGQAYSVALWIDDEPNERGRYGGALLFVRWNPGGDAPAGHHESEYLVWGETPDEASKRLVYDGGAYREILKKYARSAEATEAKARLETLKTSVNQLSQQGK